MAVSANSLSDFSRDQLITMAFQLAGLTPSEHTPIQADVRMAANFMNMELAALQSEGVIVRTIERTTLTLVSGTAEYTLPADVIDVVVGPNNEAGSIIDPNNVESVVTAMPRQSYSNLADKTTTNTARPTRVYIEKGASVKVVFWPVPDADADTWRYQKVRLFKAMDDGSVTLDLAQRWQKYVTYAVAAAVARAKSLPAEKVRELAGEAEAAKAIALADDNQRGPIQFRIRHRGRSC